MSNKILVFVEQRGGVIKKSSLEVVSRAKDIAEKLSTNIESVVIGDSIESFDEIALAGITKIIHLQNASLSKYSTSAYSELLINHIKEIDANLIFMPNTAMGNDLAPFLAVGLDAGIAVDCVDINIQENELIATRPVYAGKAMLDIQLETKRKIFTLRPNSFPVKMVSDINLELTVKEISKINQNCKVTEIKKASDKLDVLEAKKIVSGGRGLKAPENFAMIEELAKLLGAATGASRTAVDAGWRPHSEQVGQTGKTVSPDLYIAIGISGAVQHLAGMSSSRVIVAINKDKDAPIFQVADYGIVGDLFEIVPAIIEELKKG